MQSIFAAHPAVPYVHMYMFPLVQQWTKYLTVAWRSQQWGHVVDGYCKYEQRNVYCLLDKSTWTVLYTASGLLCYVNITVCMYVIWVTNIRVSSFSLSVFNPLNAELNPTCHLLALLGAHHILRVSRVRVNDCSRLLSDTNQ